MSETTPEGGAKKSGNIWTKKYGPLPLWGWAGIVLVGLIALTAYKKKQSANSGGGSSGGAGSSASTVDRPGGVDSSLVPQFVNQTYTDIMPTPAPNITVNANNSDDDDRPHPPPPDHDHDDRPHPPGQHDPDCDRRHPPGTPCNHNGYTNRNRGYDNDQRYGKGNHGRGPNQSRHRDYDDSNRGQGGQGDGGRWQAQDMPYQAGWRGYSHG